MINSNILRAGLCLGVVKIFGTTKLLEAPYHLKIPGIT